ncbi:hypothetical protein FF100_01405 [Methylobacterium terricola]|uniref:Uncharacterized protein n=1 Tax=Methylobacterium terricola TaxID=2583531 RepID=A0A5C4LMC9_9HYPH|nr:hypothetical protein [Methylobacterium terricola]TNC15951.1 hypothetical protein FF100_01405 [Methylobacterium terricola]
MDPDLVRAITAALDSRTGDGAGPAAMGRRSPVSLETSISRQNSLWDALELAGQAQSSDAASGRAAFQ